MSGKYSWAYLEDTEERGKTLYAELKRFLLKGDAVLDLACGYSPLAKPLLRDGYTIMGFDVHPKPITQLKEMYPGGWWLQLSDEHADFSAFDVLLLLGITTPLYSVYSKTLIDSFHRLLDLNRPRLVVAEVAYTADHGFYNETLELLKLKGYRRVASLIYSCSFSRAARRRCSFWRRKWVYPFWQNLFKYAGEDRLDALNMTFLAHANIKLKPKILFDSKNKLVVLPILKKVKDRLLLNKIVAQNAVENVLVVGFWDAALAFNIGLSLGCRVTGIDVIEEASRVANASLKNLPPELGENFIFSKGYAEHLDAHPLYDVIVNYCLEHVRDPQHVVSETLKHLKLGGIAYFTPPLKHGVDSPTHLHYFNDEGDLTGLIPEGYQVTIERVRFSDNSPRDNCFIMTVKK